ncbi:hypothetical protein DL763_003038 [Monosporascus cannonballus]|nr:hypothetical protein DL763_003038 [Monosporascus cannonballus]
MESALDQIKLLASTANETTKRGLLITLRQIADSLEDSNDTIHRFGYLHLQTAAVKVGFDLQLFRLLCSAQGPLSLEEMAQSTKAELLFISAVKEVDSTHYAANTITKNLCEPVSEAGISHCFETVGPQFQTIPAFFKASGYKNPNDEVRTVFQEAWKTADHAFAWFGTHPENLRYFNDYMALRREPQVSWLGVYPVPAEAKGSTPERALYVNIGGGIGHQCAQFKDRYPDIPGRVILQDLAHSIEKALQTPGVENLVHNFFDPQPIKGAKFYFIRGVLHNHPDHKVRQLLENTKAAMGPDSVLLIDEMVLPESGVNSYAAAMDLTMMAAFASMERTEAQWRKILKDVGLELKMTYNYNPPDEFINGATHMALAHNVMIRSLNAIYLQAPHIQPGEQPAFLRFAEVWHKSVEHHHKTEEDIFFPIVEEMSGQKGIMEVNAQQHNAFQSGLEAFIAYLRQCLAREAQFDGKYLVRILDGFAQVMCERLADEITTFVDFRNRGEKLKGYHARLVAEAQKVQQLGLLDDVMFMMANHDVDFEDGIHDFPPVPAVIAWGQRNIVWWAHYDWWAFAPCDRSGKMRPLDLPSE